ncbi:MAG: PulJ/GspJ family protein, partial [Acidimicrobiia bacterium]
GRRFGRRPVHRSRGVVMRFQDDSGFTLTELMMSLFLLTIVSVVFLGALQSTLFTVRDLEGTARSDDAARLALEQIDRDFRSAERMCLPALGQVGDRLEFRTRSYASAASATGYQDVIYELRDGDGDGTVDDLQRSVDGGTTWRTVVSGVVNPSVVDDVYNAAAGRPLGTVGVPLFENQGGTANALPSQGKVVTVRVWADENPNDRISPRLATTEVSGRNIWNPTASSC